MSGMHRWVRFGILALLVLFGMSMTLASFVEASQTPSGESLPPVPVAEETPSTVDWTWVAAGAILLIGAVILFVRARRQST